VEPQALRVVVRGRVQGVGFRFFVLDQARALHLSGYTRNLRDGSVEVLAVGAPDALEHLVEKLRTGPRSARVEAVERELVTPVPRFDSFSIAR
jgi:acylphosphatase